VGRTPGSSPEQAMIIERIRLTLEPCAFVDRLPILRLEVVVSGKKTQVSELAVHRDDLRSNYRIMMDILINQMEEALNVH
jgi:hypothetical protein